MTGSVGEKGGPLDLLPPPSFFSARAFPLSPPRPLSGLLAQLSALTSWTPLDVVCLIASCERALRLVGARLCGHWRGVVGGPWRIPGLCACPVRCPLAPVRGYAGGNGASGEGGRRSLWPSGRRDPPLVQRSWSRPPNGEVGLSVEE